MRKQIKQNQKPRQQERKEVKESDLYIKQYLQYQQTKTPSIISLPDKEQFEIFRLWKENNVLLQKGLFWRDMARKYNDLTIFLRKNLTTSLNTNKSLI